MQPLPRLRPIDTPTMHEELQERLKEFILVSKLQPGDPLPTEAQFSQQLGISRAAVREGLRSLEAVGVIYSRRGEGRFVKAFNLDPILQNLQYSMLFDSADVRAMIDVRERLEAGFIGDAIAAMDEGTLAELRRLMAEIRTRAEAGRYFLDKDLELHCTIYRPLNNQVLLKLLDVFCTIYKNLRETSVLVVSDPLVEVENHERILAAIEAGDAVLAQQRLREHFVGIKDRLDSVLAIGR